jgi:DNA polymerase III epsilon subunit-like protein
MEQRGRRESAARLAVEPSEAVQIGGAAAMQLRLPEPPPDGLSYAVFDFETTGLNPVLCNIIEIGWCVIRDGVAGPLQSRLVRAMGGVPHEITQLTGITQHMLDGEGESLDTALSEFLTDTAGLPLVGHNVLRFDMRFLEAACRATRLPTPHRSRYRDTAALFKAHKLGLRQRPGQDHWSFANEALDRRAPGVRFSLDVCCRDLNISLTGVARHRASADVLLTHLVYRRLVS